MVVNIHARELPCPAEASGALLDGLASAQDRLWPRHRWPAMRFDSPLAIGARGGHGPIRYMVEAYEPGRFLRFRFQGPKGFVGWHGLEVEALPGGRSLMRHTLKAEMRGAARLSWPLAFRWLHDACVEDALDCAQRALTREPLPERPLGLWVRGLRALLRRPR